MSNEHTKNRTYFLTQVCMHLVYEKIALIQALFHDMNVNFSPFDRTDPFLVYYMYIDCPKLDIKSPL